MGEFRKSILPGTVVVNSTDSGATLSGFKSQLLPFYLVSFMTLGKSPNLLMSWALARFKDYSIKVHLCSSFLGSLGMLLADPNMARGRPALEILVPEASKGSPTFP